MRAGQVVICENDPGARFFVIISGTVAVCIDDPSAVYLNRTRVTPSQQQGNSPDVPADAARDAETDAKESPPEKPAMSSSMPSAPQAGELAVEGSEPQPAEGLIKPASANGGVSPSFAAGDNVLAADPSQEAGGVSSPPQSSSSRGLPPAPPHPLFPSLPLPLPLPFCCFSASTCIFRFPPGQRTLSAPCAMQDDTTSRIYRGLSACNQLVLRTLGPGACFGERALLLEEPRTASVVALTDVEMLSLDKTSYHQLLAGMHSMIDQSTADGRPARQPKPNRIAPIPVRPSTSPRGSCEVA